MKKKNSKNFMKMKKIIVLLACMLLTAAYGNAQSTAAKLNLKDLISLSQSNDWNYALKFMQTKGWTKMSFEIKREDDGRADNNYRGKLPVTFFANDALEYADKLPGDYIKMIWGSNFNTAHGTFGGDYCYIYVSATEKTAIAFNRKMSDKSIISEFTANGFKKISETLTTTIYRNDTYELEIYRSIHYLFHNYKYLDDRKAEKERLAQEAKEKAVIEREALREKNTSIRQQRRNDGLWAHITFDTDEIVDAQNAVPVYVRNLESSLGSVILTTDLTTIPDRSSAPHIISDTPNGRGKAVEFIRIDEQGFFSNPKHKQHEFRIGTSEAGFKSERDFTVSFWIKDFDNGLIFQGVGSKTFFPTFVCTAKGYMKLHIGTKDVGKEGRGINLGDALELMFDQWHLFTTVCSDSVCNQYVDGKLTVSGTIDGANYVSKIVSWRFGGESYDVLDPHPQAESSAYANMKLDNIRIYSRALSPEEIIAIYDEEKE
jgi:hypothetical protein